MSVASIDIDIRPGASIDSACIEAQRLADLLQIAVGFKFNSVECVAVPGGDADVLSENWDNELRRELDTPRDFRMAFSNRKRG